MKKHWRAGNGLTVCGAGRGFNRADRLFRREMALARGEEASMRPLEFARRRADVTCGHCLRLLAAVTKEVSRQGAKPQRVYGSTDQRITD